MPEEDDNDFDLDLDLDLDVDPPDPAPSEPPPATPALRPKTKRPKTKRPPTPADPAEPADPAPARPGALAEPDTEEPDDRRGSAPPLQSEEAQAPRDSSSPPVPAESALQAAASRIPPTQPSPPTKQPSLPPERVPEQEQVPPRGDPSREPSTQAAQLPPPGASRASQPIDPVTSPAPTRQRKRKQQRSRKRRTSAPPEQPLRPEERLAPSPRRAGINKKLLIGIPIAVLAILIGLKLFTGGEPDEPLHNVSEIQERIDRAPPAPAPTDDPRDELETDMPPVDRSSETPDERMDRAEATLGNFFGATKKERLIAYVRHPERVKPLMLDYYSREPFKTFEFLGLKNDLQAAESIGPNFYAAEADIGGPRSQTMILEDTPKGFRVDWEYYVQYNPMNWSTFLKEMPAAPMDFRVYANLAPDYRHPFNDESRYIGVNLMTLNDTSEIMGYAERDSELGKRIERFLANKHEELCILRLQFATPPNPDTVHIRELVNPHWIITDETPD